MTRSSTVWTLIASIALGAAGTALADRRDDDGSDTPSNNALWTERESRRPTGAAALRTGISRAKGEIMVDGSNGKGGGGAYVSNWRTDWNDSFNVKFTANLEAGDASTARQKAVAGIGFGLTSATTFPLTSGYKTGVSVEIRDSVDGTTLQIIARKRGRVIASSARVPLAAGPHDFEVSWVSNPVARTVSVSVFDGAAAVTPIASVDGVERAFSGRRGGVRTALYGYSSANYAFTASFSGVSHSGDDYDDDGSDSDDDGWCDDDDHTDDNGGRGESSSYVTTADFATAWALATAVDSDVIKIEAEDGGVDFLVAEDANRVRVLRVDLATGTVVSYPPRLATADDREKMSALGGVTKSASDAVTEATTGLTDAGVYEVELEEHQGNVFWKIKLRDANGVITEVEIAAS